MIAAVNKYLVENAPWALAEEPEQRGRVATVLYTAGEALRIAAVLVAPVLPVASGRIWRQLGRQGEAEEQLLANLKWGQLRNGQQIGKVEAIFPRLDREAAVAAMRRLEEVLQKEEALARERKQRACAWKRPRRGSVVVGDGQQPANRPGRFRESGDARGTGAHRRTGEGNQENFCK